MTIEELSLRCVNRVLACMPAIDVSHRERIEIRANAAEKLRSVIAPEIESRDSENKRLLEGWNADVQWRDKLIAENQRLNEDKTRLLKNDDAREEYLRLVGESHGRLARQVRELEQENQRLKDDRMNLLRASSGDIHAIVSADKCIAELKQQVANLFDRPEADCTDAAHPAWWRGHDHTVAMLCKKIDAIVSGEDACGGVCSEPWETARKSVLGLRQHAVKLEQQVAALRRIVDRDHAGLTGACSAHLKPDLACETCYPDLNALLLEHVERSREIADERDAARQLVEELRQDAKSFCEYAVTVREHNTSAWLDAFIRRANTLAHSIGERGKFVMDGGWIEWRDAAIDAALKQETGE